MVLTAVEQRVFPLTVVTLPALLSLLKQENATKVVFPFGVFRNKEPKNLVAIMAVLIKSEADTKIRIKHMESKGKGKDKVIPLQAWTDPEGSRR
jgi:hypothetical protein